MKYEKRFFLSVQQNEESNQSFLRKKNLLFCLLDLFSRFSIHQYKPSIQISDDLPPFKNEKLLYGIDYMTNHPKSSDYRICKFFFVMYQLSPPLPSPTPNKPYFILSSHPGDCINHRVEFFQGQNFHNTTFFSTHRHPKPSEIYNNTMLLFVCKLLRHEITQSRRQ